ncbi:cache domain-containing sensor histidine kinase [Paenibacillus mucilaginosus]|uniref:histidine kinase n=1 Tax=Paenibacillus mucilaginosus (strain KNP414) TaxID=1036673 RepID=F8FBN9_PAEMK|nr:sensor histidine kinase [Paenibacillus mucilaginosus]AEI43090.1 integral membrane sensor signal transduction histidine kinase [Paenibacillus mucilaginosus KNP414]MCG7212335.1 sensor histidine kinase [Paenibacillus mucilaginosus]WDM24707.1 sensor histidine kinase [Paenibacillus mucilaginosus]
MKAFRNLRIKVKLFLMIILLLILIILLAFGSLYYSYSIYDKQLYEKSSRLLNLSSTTVDTELKKLETLSLNIIADSRIQQGLKELGGNPMEYNGYTIRRTLAERLWELISSDDRYVQSVHLIDSQGRESKYGDSILFSEQKNVQMIQEAKRGDGAVRWLYPDASDPMLIMVREVRSYEPLTLKPIGTLFLRINIKRLVEDYAGIAAENSDIILKSGPSMVYPYREIPENTAEALQPLASPEGYVITALNGDAAFVSQVKSPYTGWIFYNIVPYNEIFQTIIWLKNSMIVLFIAAVIVVVAIGMVFARSLTKPIESLIGEMKDIQKGDLESLDADALSAPIQQMDEVGLLHRNFRLMMARIQTLIKENYAKQLTIKETEFKALQAQINPHFLYNTLESINWMAKKNAQKEISSMAVSLGFLLRTSISLKQNTITLGEELDIVDHYIRIQTYRFRSRLDFRMEVPDAYLTAALPKLTLQPLLENAIQYGLEPKIGPCTIRVYAEAVEDKLFLVVEDNGAGMEEEYVQRLLQGAVQTRGTGIGLLNIRERIQLTFGEPYGIEVESRKGAGTRVKVLLPLQQEG